MGSILHVCGVVLAAGLCPAALGQNLLTNGSFEAVGSGFEEFAGWGVFNSAFADGPADVSNEVVAQDGVRSVKMFSGFFGTGIQSDSGVFQVVPVVAGASYTLSAYTQVLSIDPLAPLDFSNFPAEDAGHLPLLIVDFKDAGGANLASAEVPAFVTGTDPYDQWVFKSVTAAAPAGAVSAQITPLLITFGNNAGSLFWDNIVFETAAAGCNAADCDENGSLTLDDIDCFVTSFLAQTDGADCDGNGQWTLDDIDCFIGAFLAGCP